MCEAEIFDKLKTIIKTLFSGNKIIDFSHININTKLVENLGFDSMDLIMISFAIEKEFNIDISSLSISSYSTVKTIVDYIKEKQSAN